MSDEELRRMTPEQLEAYIARNLRMQQIALGIIVVCMAVIVVAQLVGTITGH